ncbi:MAG: hypothetical protein M0Z58_04615, partial [Nitrospiraceae bacterium]|nr:hypothetical protein [Nitrospiraceae bacterium]
LGRTHRAKSYLGSFTGGQFAHRAAYSLGLIAKGQGDTALATRLFQTASGSAEPGTRLPALLALAGCQVKLGRPDDALAALGKADRIRSYGDPYRKGQLLMARAMLMKGQYMRPAAILKGLLVKKAYAEAAMGELQDIMESAVAHEKSQKKFLELWRIAGDCLMQPERAPLVFNAGERLKTTDAAEFVDTDLWVARNGDRKLRRLAAANLAVYYADEGDGRQAGIFFSKAGLPMKDVSTRRLRARVRYLNGQYMGALRDLLSIKDLSGADLDLLAKVIPGVKDARAIGLIEKRLQKQKTGAPAALYVALADAVYEMGQKAHALELYSEAAARPAPAGGALDSADLKWALFRIQSMAKDPGKSLSALQKQDGLMGRYAQARIEEENLHGQ